MRGDLVTIGGCPEWQGSCQFKGEMSFRDTFDFDPHWNWTPADARTARGERRTRIAYMLAVGTNFKVSSATANVKQWANSSAVAIEGVAGAGEEPQDGAGD